MAFFNEADAVQKNEFIRIINQRWWQLYASEKEWTDNIAKYLFAINTGGAVAVLGYLGAVQNDVVQTPIGFGIKGALILFVIGITLVGLFSARMFYAFEALFTRWREETKSFLNNQIDWQKLITDDEQRSKNNWIDYFLPWSAFGVWVLGVVLGLVDFWK